MTEEILGQVPALAVLVFLVFRFLTYISKRDQTMNEIVANNTKVLSEVRIVLREINNK